MNGQQMSALMLRARLALMGFGPVACGAALLAVLGLGALLWIVPQQGLQAGRQTVALGLAALPPVAVKSAPVQANENLALFYETLGEQRYAEQQLKTLFGIAAKSGLVLSQGEYKAATTQDARLSTYQVTLPVKGSYGAVWQFGLLALRAIPFASLDEISFRRDNIADPNVEARLRLTLYLDKRQRGAE